MIQQSLSSQKLSKKTQNLLKNFIGYSTMINNSSKFWSESVSNNNFCSCNRDTDLNIDEEQTENNNNINLKKQKESLFKVLPKSDDDKKTYTKEWTKEEHDLLYDEYFKKNNKNIKYLKLNV